MSETGKVSVVVVKKVGSTLEGDHTAGVTDLQVYDLSEFSETGGTLQVGEETYAYGPWTGEAEDGTLTLSGPTLFDYVDGQVVAVLPLATETVATVVIDDEGDGVPVDVPHRLRDKLSEGIRVDGQGETVELDDTDDGWVMVDVVKESPQINPDAIDSVRVQDEDSYIEVGPLGRIKIGYRNPDDHEIGSLYAIYDDDLGGSIARFIANNYMFLEAARIELSTSGNMRFSSGNNITAAAPEGEFQVFTGNALTALRVDVNGRLFSAGGIMADDPASGTDLVITDSGRITRKSSSAGVKDDVAPAELPADVISRLRPVTFRYKTRDDEETSRTVLGLIADEVYEVSPLLANLDRQGRPTSLDTQALVTALVTTVQRLEQRVQDLETGTGEARA